MTTSHRLQRFGKSVGLPRNADGGADPAPGERLHDIFT
jgi:hypothetical protein